MHEANDVIHSKSANNQNSARQQAVQHQDTETQ